MTKEKTITLDTRINDCNGIFSNRLRHALACQHIETIADLCSKKCSEVLRFRNLGRRGLEEIERFFQATGLQWEYKLPESEYIPFRIEVDCKDMYMTVRDGKTTIGGNMTKEAMRNIIRGVPQEILSDI